MSSPAQTVKLHPLPGGIHPPENKDQSLTGPIGSLALPEQLYLPLSQAGGQAPTLLVAEGDRVLKGQKLAAATGPRGLNVHAGSSGIIREIAPRPMPTASGLPELCITLETDGQDQWIPHQGLRDYRQSEAEEILALIAEAGISGLGGAGFPSATKLAGRNSPIHTLIINAAECEPFITADDALIREYAGEVIEGVHILLHLLKPKRCILAIEDNKMQAHDALQLIDRDPAIELVVIPNKYPSGAEKQLIQILTGKEIPSGSLTVDAGIVCQNVGTVRAVYKAVCHGEPLISRITTLTGAALERPQNVEALIGTPMEILLTHAGLKRERLSRLIMGGPLMGLTLNSLDLPLVKISNCLLATTDSELPPAPPERACIRCGLCTQACPVNLLPQQLYWFTRAQEHDKAKAHHLFDCIECGACAYACPSHIPLVQYYRAGKAEIREEEDKHRRGEHSRQRFEFHQQRLEKQKLREEQRRKERAELARKAKEAKQKGQSPEDEIKAALARVKAKKARQQEENDQP